MQVSIKTTSGLERRMTIVVPSETFEQQVTERLAATAKRARLPGFRPGKVPVKEVRRRFGAAVRQEVAGELMQQSFVTAIQQESLDPAGQPSLEVISMNPGTDLEFAATFEVFPQVELLPFSTFTIRRPHAVVTDADIDRMVASLREQRTTFEDVERPAADGDRVTIDFKGFRDGEPFAGGSGDDVAFVLGRQQMIADFETGVRGHAAGAETTFEATFPEDYRVEDLRGRTVRFEVKVKAVAEPKLPALDDGFFKAFGVEEGGLDAFRAEVRSNMERELDNAIRQQLKRQVMDEIERTHTVQLPVGMVAREIGALRHQMAQQMGLHDHGHDHDHDHDHSSDLPDVPDDLFRPQAERRVKVGLVVNAVIAAKNVTADAGRVRARIEEIAKPYAQPEQVVNWYYSQQEQLSQVQMAVVEEQVVDLILADANVLDVDSSYQDVIAGRALATEQTGKEEAA